MNPLLHDPLVSPRCSGSGTTTCTQFPIKSGFEDPSVSQYSAKKHIGSVVYVKNDKKRARLLQSL